MSNMSKTEIKEMSLKSEISRQVSLKECEKKTLSKMNELFAESLYEMDENKVPRAVIDSLVWKYVEINHLWWNGDSEKLGIYSTIQDYTNKAGKTFKAHYSKHGHYICKASSDKPISYKGYFEMKPETFDYSLKDKKIEFIPKPLKI